jgi:hypothetical protein
MKYILSIAKEYKIELLTIYFYMVIAQLLFLAEPYVLGKMIDGLIDKNYWWTFVFLSIIIFENFFIYRRMVFDTKIYTLIYNNIVLKYLKNDKSEDPSRRIARTEMSNNIINFLENDVHYYIYAILSVIGTLFFIFLQNPLTAFIVLSCTIPISIIVYTFYKKIAQYTQVAHDHYEQKVQILSDNDENLVDTFFKRRRRILISGSTLQGKNWTALNSTKSIFLIISLIVLTSQSKITQGQAVAIYAYINQFLISLMSIPIGVETFTRMKDVISRIKE